MEKSKDGAALTATAADAAATRRNQRCQGCNALVVMDSSGFPAPRPGNPIFPPGTPFSATIAVNGRHRATVRNEPLPQIAEFLGNTAGAPVKDETGLTGEYDLHLEYVPDRPPAPLQDPAGLPAPAADPGPDLFAALEAQLGLKLVPKKVPVEMLVIDHADEVPTEN